MKNSFINIFKSKIKINIKGKNIDRFIERIIKNNIKIFDLKKIKYNEIDLIIFKDDLECINNIKTIYEIDIKRKYGFLNIKDKINKNKYFIIFTLLGISIIYFLSNLIFSIEVIHNDSDLRRLIKKELKNYGIEKYHFKKNYHMKEKIKLELLNKYRDKIEWLEIEDVGTKYIVKLEERITNKKEEKFENRNLVAKKNGIIISVDAKTGEIVKNKNDYVKKGDVIVSGEIYLNENLKSQVKAEGTVYAETWYTVNIKFPYHYKSVELTDESKTVYTLKLFNKYYDLFNFNKYKTYNIENKTILKNNIIPISFIRQKQFKTKVVDKKYNKKNIEINAIKEAEKTLLKKIGNDSSIIKYKVLSKKNSNDILELKVFFTLRENITDYKKIYIEKNNE